MYWRYSLIILFIVFIIYAPGLSGGFIYDDYFNFLHNKAITETEFNLKGIWSAMQSGVAGPLGRPIPMVSFFLNYKLSGIEPFGYKLFNVAIHAINAILVFFVSCNLFNAYFSRAKTDITQSQTTTSMALWVALLWAVHPINLTAVLYVVQRMTSMAGTFTLLGVLAYCLLRKDMALKITWLYLSMILVLGFLAMFCKENGVLLFLYLFIVESFIYRWKFKDQVQKKIIAVFFGFIFIVSLIIGGYVLINGGISFDYTYREFSLQERLLTQSRAIWFYMVQILLPQAHLFGLHHDDFLLSASLFEPISTFWSIAGLGLIIIISIVTYKKTAWLGFGVFFFLGGHLLESSIFPLNLVHEHRNYIPSLGLIIIFVVGIKLILNKINIINSNFLFMLFVFLFSLITFGRASDWGDMNQFAEISMQKHPDSVNANYESAFIFMKSYEQTHQQFYLTKAIKALQKAEEKSKHSMKSAVALAHVLSIAGKQPEAALINKIKLNFDGGRKIKTEEIIALRQFVNCKLESICNVDDTVFHELFNGLFNNPLLQGRLRDDALYIYATFLNSVANRGQNALYILHDIVNRNPDILEYKVQLISILLSNGKDEEAQVMMNDLAHEYGLKWNIVKQ
jgi:protein O-mannosyl-transferase